jgi:hypothetical protein
MLSALAPSIAKAEASASGQVITIDRGNFADATVPIGNTAHPATFVNDKKLTVSITPLPAAGTAMKVRNPDGKESQPFNLTVGPCPRAVRVSEPRSKGAVATAVI